MVDITRDTKLIRVPCEQRFLSCMAFSVYEVVRVVCLAVYSKSNDPPKDATSKVISLFARNRKMIEITSDTKLIRSLFLTIIIIFDIPIQTKGHTF